MLDSDKQTTDIESITKEYTIHCDDKDIKVISIFEGTVTASEILYGLAVNRILYEKSTKEKK